MYGKTRKSKQRVSNRIKLRTERIEFHSRLIREIGMTKPTGKPRGRPKGSKDALARLRPTRDGTLFRERAFSLPERQQVGPKRATNNPPELFGEST
jgi:hypothetical protein